VVLIDGEVRFPEGTTILHTGTIVKEHEGEYGMSGTSSTEVWFLTRHKRGRDLVYELYLLEVFSIGNDYREPPQMDVSFSLVATSGLIGCTSGIDDGPCTWCVNNMEWIVAREMMMIGSNI